jgi:single-stranded-DNA-specific exonuclease
MMELAEINPAGLSEEHIGFELGPRLNALGRLADANPAVEFLTTSDPVQARVLAAQLEGLNAQRRLLTAQVLGAALAQIEREPALLDEPALVLSHPAWPAGVIGIVASKLADLYDRPAVLIASPPGVAARGSARSLPGLDITAAIASQSHLLKNYGGHPMAAGFSLDPDLIPEFRQGLLRSLEILQADRLDERYLQLDGYLPLSALTIELVTDLERLAPFGPGNPRLVLAARNLRMISSTTMGRGEEHLQLILEDEEEQRHRAIWWGGGNLVSVRFFHEWDWLTAGASFDLAYTARSSNYRGFPEVQVEWVAARPTEETVIEIASRSPALLIEDHRHAEYPLKTLKQLLEQRGMVVWAEGEAHDRLKEAGIEAFTRCQLTPAPDLIIWSSPPDQQTLREAVMAVSPQRVHLFAVDPGSDHPKTFLERLTGLVKYALRLHQGHVTLRDLAAATGQPANTVRMGISWLESQGHIGVIAEEEGVLILRKGSNPDQQKARLLFEKLALLLNETAAFREFYERVDTATLRSFF